MTTYSAPDAAAATLADRALVPITASTGSRVTDHRWLQRGSLLVLLAGTAMLYLWGLSASGYANSFYSAAAQAGSKSWTAFLYGSLDAGNAITVDKPPASLWLMALSVRIFGLSPWSILVPQALLGVVTVGVMYTAVRRTSGHWAGVLAGAVLATTPVAVLMFRFNNPDALLVFLLTLASYAVLRATERASARWLVAAGVLVGLGFLTKMLQAFVILPVLGLVYLLAAPTSVRRRLLHLLTAFAAMILSAGWWVAVVELVPAAARPYVGGSTDNSVLDLIFGYNGFGRIFGQGAPAGGSGPPGSFGSVVGPLRMVQGVSGGMVAWLIPAALLLGAGGLLVLRRRPRTDVTQAALLLWLGTLVMTGLVFSFMAGIYHDYYTVALAPGIAGAVAIGGSVLWRDRSAWWARIWLATAMGATTVIAVLLLGQASGNYAHLRWLVGIAGGLATVALLRATTVRRLAAVAVALALLAGLTGPAAYTLDTAATAHTGPIVTAGPVRQTNGAGRAPGQFAGGPFGPAPQGSSAGQPPQGPAPQSASGSGPTGGPMQGAGTANAELVQLLVSGAAGFRWVAAITGSQLAATYQLATQQPVMAIGGFNGGDPAPTLQQFQALVAAGKIHYYVASRQGAGRGAPGGSGAAEQVASWVSEHYIARTVGNATVYDLTQAQR